MKTAEETIEFLDGIWFHDMPVDSIEFRTIPETQLILKLLYLKEDEMGLQDKDYTKLKITFNQIQYLTTDALELNSKSDFELFSFDYEFEESFKCKLMFLTGFGGSSLTIELTCNSIEINE